MGHDTRASAACALGLVLAAAAGPAGARGPEPAVAVPAGVAQLRHAAGEWRATTEFLRPDGSVARRAVGTYRFEWVVPDRVLVGRSEIQELGLASGILFYLSEKRGVVEMVSVGADGHLWVMTGPSEGEVRTTPVTPQEDGSTLQLRFTRLAVAADRFESRMELSSDGGQSWSPGNHQVFERIRPGS